jgi:hypothetical protein
LARNVPQYDIPTHSGYAYERIKDVAIGKLASLQPDPGKDQFPLGSLHDFDRTFFDDSIRTANLNSFGFAHGFQLGVIFQILVIKSAVFCRINVRNRSLASYSLIPCHAGIVKCRQCRLPFLSSPLEPSPAGNQRRCLVNAHKPLDPALGCPGDAPGFNLFQTYDKGQAVMISPDPKSL